MEEIGGVRTSHLAPPFIARNSPHVSGRTCVHSFGPVSCGGPRGVETAWKGCRMPRCCDTAQLSAGLTPATTRATNATGQQTPILGLASPRRGVLTTRALNGTPPPSPTPSACPAQLTACSQSQWTRGPGPSTPGSPHLALQLRARPHFRRGIDPRHFWSRLHEDRFGSAARRTDRLRFLAGGDGVRGPARIGVVTRVHRCFV